MRTGIEISVTTPEDEKDSKKEQNNIMNEIINSTSSNNKTVTGMKYNVLCVGHVDKGKDTTRKIRR